MQRFVQCVDLAYQAIDTPFSLACHMLLQAGQWDDLVSLQVDPARYVDSEAYGRDAAAASLLRKCAGLPVSFDPRRAAVSASFEAERCCGMQNVKITRELASCQTTLPALLDKLRYRMNFLLGTKVPELHYRYNSGSTVSVPYRLRLLPNKVCLETIRMTASLWPFLPSLGEAGFIPPTSEIEEHEGSVYQTVPKTSRTDRSIAKECDLNAIVQGAIGRAMRRRLQRVGLLLEGGQSELLHKRLAREGSRTGEFATIDLSSASDTICYNLVREIAPESWFELMDASRAPKMVLKGDDRTSDRSLVLEKFSTMGNGYTFELETAIFSACALHACEMVGEVPVIGHNVSVYGDDIIVPARAAETLIHILNDLGFLVNTRKSFASGPFRESCGGDYFDGVDVRPVFQDVVPATPIEWFSFHNRLYRLATRYPAKGWDRCLKKARESLPSALRKLGGPEHLGDVVLHGLQPCITVKRSVRRISTLQPSSVDYPLSRWDDTSAVQTALYLCACNGETPIRGIAGLEVDRISISSSHVGSKPLIRDVDSTGYKVQRIPTL